MDWLVVETRNTVSCKRLWRGERKTHFEEKRNKEGRNSRIKGKKKIRGGRRKVAESRLASFLCKLARQLREKLVLPLAGSGRCEGFEQGAGVRNTKGWVHPLISCDLVSDATTQLKRQRYTMLQADTSCEIKLPWLPFWLVFSTLHIFSSFLFPRPPPLFFRFSSSNFFLFSFFIINKLCIHRVDR